MTKVVWLLLRERNVDPLTGNSSLLAKGLSHFFAQFEKGPDNADSPHLDTADDLFTLQVKRVLKAVNIKQAAGPGGIPYRVLRHCTHQLTEVFTDIFNLSQVHAAVPACLKTATIIPVPKHTNISSLNDYSSVTDL